MTTKTNHTAPATSGRERTCVQCGGLYRSPRRSNYCSNACRMKAKRGAAPHATTPALSVITRALIKLGMVGPIDPAGTLGLTAHRAQALDELSYIFQRQGWGYITVADFDEAMHADSVRSYSSDSPEAVERKRLQARQRIGLKRYLENS